MNLRSLFARRKPMPELDGEPLPKLVCVHLEMPTLPPGLGLSPAGNYVGLHLLEFALVESLRTRCLLKQRFGRYGELNNGTILIETKRMIAAAEIVKTVLEELGLLGDAEIWLLFAVGWDSFHPRQAKGPIERLLRHGEIQRDIGRINSNMARCEARARELADQIQRSQEEQGQ